MCEANAYLADENGENLLLESVDKILPEGPDTWRLVSILGEQKIVEGRLSSMQLVDHRIIFESVAASES